MVSYTVVVCRSDLIDTLHSLPSSMTLYETCRNINYPKTKKIIIMNKKNKQMLTCVRYIHIDTAAAYAASATVVAQKALSQQCVDGDSISISSPVPLKTISHRLLCARRAIRLSEIRTNLCVHKVPTLCTRWDEFYSNNMLNEALECITFAGDSTEEGDTIGLKRRNRWQTAAAQWCVRAEPMALHTACDELNSS